MVYFACVVGRYIHLCVSLIKERLSKIVWKHNNSAILEVFASKTVKSTFFADGMQFYCIQSYNCDDTSLAFIQQVLKFPFFLKSTWWSWVSYIYIFLSPDFEVKKCWPATLLAAAYLLYLSLPKNIEKLSLN